MAIEGDQLFDIDELSKIRVLEGETATKTAQLKTECKEFIDSK